MGKEITFDKFIRWAGVTLIVLAVLYMTPSPDGHPSGKCQQ